LTRQDQLKKLMPRKRKKGRGLNLPSPSNTRLSRNADDSTDEDFSDSSISSHISVGTDMINALYMPANVANILESYIVDLKDKTSSTRCEALQKFNETFRSKFCNEYLQENFDYLQSACVNIFRRSYNANPKECLEVLQLVGLSCVTLTGKDACAFLHPFMNDFEDAIRHTEDVEVVKSVCQVLSACFPVGCDALDEDEEFFTLLQDYWTEEDKDDEIRAACLRTWLLLAVQKEPTAFLTEYNSVLWDLYQLLEETESVPFRCTLGETIAFMFNLYLENSDLLETDLEDESGLDIETVITLFNGFSGDFRTGKKKKLGGQRKIFRRLIDLLEQSWDPEFKFKIRKTMFAVPGWQRVLELESLREFLRGGFQTQFILNYDLTSIFGLTDLQLTLKQYANRTQDDKKAEYFDRLQLKKNWKSERKRARTFKENMI